MDLLARQMPGGRATPTPLPDPPSLTQLGRDDGSLQPKLPQIITGIISIRRLNSCHCIFVKRVERVKRLKRVKGVIASGRANWT